MLKKMFCKHEFEHTETFYGDEINAVGKRHEYTCKKCGKRVQTDYAPHGFKANKNVQRALNAGGKCKWK